MWKSLHSAVHGGGALAVKRWRSLPTYLHHNLIPEDHDHDESEERQSEPKSKLLDLGDPDLGLFGRWNW